MSSRAALLLEALELKELDRAGWLRVGVSAPESVAAHSWGVAWLALVLCPAELDRERVLTIALVHDLPEVRVGDITPFDGMSEDQKHAQEAAAAAALLGGEGRLLAAWREYAVGESPEAHFVHVLDKLDMALQAIRYARAQGADTDEFIESARRKVPAALWSVVESALS